MEDMLVKTKNKHGKIVEAKLTSFSFWECGKIGINIDDLSSTKLFGGFDLSLDEAKCLMGQLQNAITIYEEMEAQLENQ